MKIINVGSDFSGVGSFDQALTSLGINHKTIFACDMDKYARKSYIENYGKPDYFPENVYDREILGSPLDIYMTSPPCQGFSLAGKRGGSILFLNSHEFIRKNKPRYFIFENVKGLLSHDKINKTHLYGNTFNKWLQYLGGKSINGNPVLFPHKESIPYHIYHKVLNAKDYGVPQNRERVFIVGIRDDVDNSFSWPKETRLDKDLQDVLENEVDKKYFLSEKMINGLLKKESKFNGKFKAKELDSDFANAITTKAGQRSTDNFIKVGFINQDSQASQVFSDLGISPTLCAGAHGYVQLSRRRTEEGRKKRKHSMAKGIDYTSFKDREFFVSNQGKIANTITTSPSKDNLITNFHLIRRLTPRECFRLMGFPDSYKIIVSDTQAYKQAGNSIVKDVLEKIISKLDL